ncbi:unnamed protein product [Paramecium pentaurelia]|uniref:Uncharacterized protein n=1 Tax=Paramecium pentaurelia TaxID=43138 RepID=A0A8S1XZ99_9CILI|nr:unnamed protein product [Paramecium pentaurelia]
MKKLLIVSGLAGSKKQEVVQILNKQMKTKIIPADSLQVYKNWPISTNWPKENLSNYELIGKFDGLTNFITTFQFKKEVLKILQNMENPIIEGGCCFFINQILKSRQEQFSEEQIQIADQKAKEILLNCSDPQNLLKQLCQKYNESPPITDKYRLIRAIRFALLTKGREFQSPFKYDEYKLCEILDVRGFFLSEPQGNICQIIYERCNEMLKQGVLQEFYAFYKIKQIASLNQLRLNTPIGYDLFVELINDYMEININTHYSQSKKERLKRERVKKFIEIFYIKWRQYTSYQRRYVRSNFNEFIWIDNNLNNIPELISQYYSCERQEFNNQLNSIDSIVLKIDKHPESMGKQMKIEVSLEMQEFVYETMQNMI